METTIKMTNDEAKKLYSTSSPEWKQILESNFGKKLFLGDITDRVKTIEDAFTETGRPIVDYSMLPADLQTYFENLYYAVVIAEALNEGWVPDWDNSNEEKWTCWFKMSSSGFRFDYSLYARSFTLAGSGSRLHFKTKALVEYAVTRFPEVFKNIQIG